MIVYIYIKNYTLNNVYGSSKNVEVNNANLTNITRQIYDESYSFDLYTIFPTQDCV